MNEFKFKRESTQFDGKQVNSEKVIDSLAKISEDLIFRLTDFDLINESPSEWHYKITYKCETSNATIEIFLSKEINLRFCLKHKRFTATDIWMYFSGLDELKGCIVNGVIIH